MFDAPLVTKLIELALEEDCAHNDVTANVTVPADHSSKAKVIARQRLVVCGLDVVPEIIKVGRWGISFSRSARDGEWVDDGEVLVELAGKTRELLSAERTVLNFLQRMCGVARIGGASNHRFSLADMVLVKNNHIDAHPRGIRGALEDVVAKRPVGMSWEVEVRDLEELRIALEYNPTMIMLDNFKDAALKDAVGLVRAAPNHPLIEVSGGVSKDRLAAIQASGVDAVSVGALTTQAPNVDISMRILLGAI